MSSGQPNAKLPFPRLSTNPGQRPIAIGQNSRMAFLISGELNLRGRTITGVSNVVIIKHIISS